MTPLVICAPFFFQFFSPYLLRHFLLENIMASLIPTLCSYGVLTTAVSKHLSGKDAYMPNTAILF